MQSNRISFSCQAGFRLLRAWQEARLRYWGLILKTSGRLLRFGEARDEWLFDAAAYKIWHTRRDWKKRTGIRDTNEENIVVLKAGVGVSGSCLLQWGGDFTTGINSWHIEIIQSRLTLNWFKLNSFKFPTDSTPPYCLHPGRSNTSTPTPKHTPVVYLCQGTTCGLPETGWQQWDIRVKN